MTINEYKKLINIKLLKELGSKTNERTYYRIDTIVSVQEICPIKELDVDEKEGIKLSCKSNCADFVAGVCLSIAIFMISVSFVDLFGALVMQYENSFGPIFFGMLLLGICLYHVIFNRMKRSQARKYISGMKQVEKEISDEIEIIADRIYRAGGGIIPRKYCYFDIIYSLWNRKDNITVEEYVAMVEKNYSGKSQEWISKCAIDGKPEISAGTLDEIYRKGTMYTDSGKGIAAGSNTFEGSMLEKLETERTMSKALSVKSGIMIIIGIIFAIGAPVLSVAGLIVENGEETILPFGFFCAIAAYLFTGGIEALIESFKRAFSIFISHLMIPLNLMGAVICVWWLMIGGIIGCVLFLLLPIVYVIKFNSVRRFQQQEALEYFETNPKSVAEKLLE